MFYLSKFCRICIQTGGSLLDINSTDYDSITLSEKLEECTKMVITKESLSTQICMLCVQKLRISYQFQSMCNQSSKILQGYLAELISVSDKITPEQFKNSDLCVTITPLNSPPRPKRKRVSKEQRCSLLKKLLLNIKNDVNNPDVTVIKQESITATNEPSKGGLRGLINFTKNFDYGYEIDPQTTYDVSPLEKLTDFSETFFYNDFSDFRNTILYILNTKEDDSEDDSMFEPAEELESVVKFEEVIVEPDIKIKSELDFDEESNYEVSNYVEACYNDENSESYVNVKREPVESDNSATHVGQNRFLAEIIPISSYSSSKNNLQTFSSTNNNNNSLADKYKTLYTALNTPINQTTTTDLLGQFVAQFSHGRSRTISPNSLRCRTRGNPYINPLLQKQFQMRSFKCITCNRRFKSPGYLKAHMSKVKH